MAQWWELTLPIAGTLAGAVAGGLVQGRNNRKQARDQARNQRDALVLAEKTEVYIEVLAAIREAYFVLKNRDKLILTAKCANEIHYMLGLIGAGLPDPWPERRRKYVEHEERFWQIYENLHKLYDRVYLYAPSAVVESFAYFMDKPLNKFDHLMTLRALIREDLGIVDSPSRQGNRQDSLTCYTARG
ncbi:hypothetical protein [Micromonospora sp. NPDC048830]|uniref:hypothetical protein n=1 Tax=Micromonospora sp. NPDC048830 TaxID=3364257 RepID=UPI00371D6357